MITVVLTILRGARPLLIILLASPLLLLAQKYDYVWQFGNPADTTIGMVNQLRFNANGTYTLDSVQSEVWSNSMALSMADSAGNLSFVSNGLLLYNAYNLPIAGSDSFNFRFNQFGLDYGGPQGKDGIAIPNSYIALPWPDSEGVYVVLHQTYEEYPVNFKTSHQYYTVIDMRINGWLGQVTKLNQVLLDKHVETGQASACRHSNGRDWWVLIKEAYPSNAYHRFLLTPTGWHRFEDVQQIGGGGLQEGTLFGSNGVIFSPDGQRHVRSYGTGIHVFDFDRCTGLLSNYRKLPVFATVPPAYPDYMFNPVISANGQYLYIAGSPYLKRYDLTAPNIAASRDTVSTWDGYGAAQLGPNNKLYSAGFASGFWLTSIEQPDSANCLPAINSVGKLACSVAGLPIYPNYRLGQVPGNPCPSGGGIPMDTTVGVAPLPSTGSGSGLLVWPNPAREKAMIALPAQTSGTLQLISATGVVLNSLAFSGQQVEISLMGVPAGVYTVRVQTQEGAMHTAKLVVLP